MPNANSASFPSVSENVIDYDLLCSEVTPAPTKGLAFLFDLSCFLFLSFFITHNPPAMSNTELSSSIMANSSVLKADSPAKAGAIVPFNKAQFSRTSTPLLGLLSSYTRKLPCGIVEHLTGGVKVVVNGPMFVQVTRLFTSSPGNTGLENSSVATILVAEGTDIFALSLRGSTNTS